MPALRWETSPVQAFDAGYRAYVQTVRATVYALLQSYVPRMESWMKANAVWDDQTGNARQSLWADVKQLTNQTILWFGHGMEYGIWLEIANSGRYSVLSPALDHFGPLIFKDLQAIFA